MASQKQCRRAPRRRSLSYEDGRLYEGSASNLIHINTISRKWSLEDGISYGRKTASGRIIACDPLIFNEGDFVDVRATVDIVSTSFNGRSPYSTVAVRFSFSQVVRILRGEELDRVRTSVIRCLLSLTLRRFLLTRLLHPNRLNLLSLLRR